MTGTLVELISRAEYTSPFAADSSAGALAAPPPDRRLFEAFGTICETLDDAPRFGVGARVFARRTNPVTWASATVVRETYAGRRDVRLDSGEMLMSLERNAVLAPGVSGPGAVLRSAASLGAYDLVKSLLERGISPFECDPNGETPLHLAARQGRDHVCKLLVESHADSSLPDLFEHSAHFIALSQGHLNVLQVFEPSATASDLTPFSQKASALHQAAADGDTRTIAQCLADEGAEVVHETFANLVTPLHVACLNAQVEAVQLLLEANASPTARTKRGVSSLMAALDFLAQLSQPEAAPLEPTATVEHAQQQRRASMGGGSSTALVDRTAYRADHRRVAVIIERLLEADEEAAARQQAGDGSLMPTPLASLRVSITDSAEERARSLSFNDRSDDGSWDRTLSLDSVFAPGRRTSILTPGAAGVVAVGAVDREGGSPSELGDDVESPTDGRLPRSGSLTLSRLASIGTLSLAPSEVDSADDFAPPPVRLSATFPSPLDSSVAAGLPHPGRPLVRSATGSDLGRRGSTYAVGAADRRGGATAGRVRLARDQPNAKSKRHLGEPSRRKNLPLPSMTFQRLSLTFHRPPRLQASPRGARASRAARPRKPGRSVRPSWSSCPRRRATCRCSRRAASSPTRTRTTSCSCSSCAPAPRSTASRARRGRRRSSRRACAAPSASCRWASLHLIAPECA